MSEHDPKELGIPNINFSFDVVDDERKIKFKQQRLERGFDDSETWNLDYTIARFIVPRLACYVDIAESHILRSSEQIEKTNKALVALKTIIADGDGNNIDSKVTDDDIAEGLHCLADIFRSLWW